MDDLGVNAAGVCSESFGGEGFGGEGSVVGGRGEREVNLGGAAAEECGGVKVEASVFASFCGDGLTADAVEKRWRGSDRTGWWAGYDALVVAAEFVERVLPAIAFVFDQALKHGEGGSFGRSRRLAANIAEEGCDAGEVGDFGEEAADFCVGILAGLESAEEFEDEFLIVEDGGVGLLG